MTQNDKVNDLFENALAESEIKHFSICGFDKYIVYNERGTLFVFWFNKDTKKCFLGRTKLMMKKYARAKLPSDVMPDYGFVYNMTVRWYNAQKRLSRDFDRILNILDSFYDGFCEKTK